VVVFIGDGGLSQFFFVGGGGEKYVSPNPNPHTFNSGTALTHNNVSFSTVITYSCCILTYIFRYYSFKSLQHTLVGRK
jgi:hypothetical protein